MKHYDPQIICSLCGFRFFLSEARTTVCQSCPLHGKCAVLAKCPNCGYENPLVSAPSWLTGILSRIGGWISRKRSDLGT